MRGSSQLEDDIAVMTSRSNILKTLRRLDFTVTYHERSRFITKERYDYPPFRVRLDSSALQACGIPITIRVNPADSTYSVSAEGKNINLYNPQTQEVMDEFVADFKLNETVRMGQPFSADHLGFSIDFLEDRRYDPETEYFFQVHSLEQQLMNYGSRLTVEAPDSKRPYRSADHDRPIAAQRDRLHQQADGDLHRKRIVQAAAKGPQDH
ncbi:MAG: hypothetical protein IPJ85_02370 [Flavobacteriales bacterium]|nr:hypothetical protein [Flavobacteriales bacterium]